jgi:hypothetical protein
VTFQDSPQEDFGPPPVQRNLSYSLDDDEDLMEEGHEGPSPGPTSIPRPIGGRNAARRTKKMEKEMDAKAVGLDLIASLKKIHEQQERVEADKRERDRNYNNDRALERTEKEAEMAERQADRAERQAERAERQAEKDEKLMRMKTADLTTTEPPHCGCWRRFS